MVIKATVMTISEDPKIIKFEKKASTLELAHFKKYAIIKGLTHH